MLLTDGSPNDTESLRVYESAILEVAHAEAIDLNVKLDLALEEVSESVVDVLLSRANDGDAMLRRQKGVSDVVVTPQLKRWHAVHTLEVFYRDVFNNQLNDRYRQKFQEYRELSRNARHHTLRFGIGLVLNPIPQAKTPTVDFGPGSVVPQSYYIQVAWVFGNGQEGAPSPMTTGDAVAGTVPVITAVDPPPGAAGYNVYVGLTPDTLGLQNSSPVPVGTSFTVDSNGPISGRPPGNGQVPDVYIAAAPNMTRV